MESKILCWLTIPQVWEKYAHFLKVDWFSPENRPTVAKALQAHAPIPSVGAIGSAWDHATQLHFEDWLIRCRLNEIQVQVNKDINMPGLMNVQALDKIAEQCSSLTFTETETRILDPKTQAAPVRFPTGLKFLTSALEGGLSFGEFVLISSPPHGGKTHWLRTLGANYLMRGFRVIDFVLEDLPSDVLGYYRSALQGRTSQRFSLQKDLCLYNFSGESCTTATISRLIKECKIDDRPTVIILDYADLLGDHHEREEWVRDRFISHRLRALANEHKVILLSATQGMFNMFDQKVPGLANLSGYKVGKAAAADVVLVWKPDNFTNDGLLAIAKARGRKRQQRSFDLRTDWDKFIITVL